MIGRIENLIWILLWSLSLVFSFCYIWFTLFPGAYNPAILSYFNPEVINAGRTYSRIPRLMYIISFLTQVAFLAFWIWSGKAKEFLHKCKYYARGSDWALIKLIFLVLWFALSLISLPFNFMNGFIWQKVWGFSTQTMASWFNDLLLESGLDFLFSGVGVLLLFLALRLWPKRWWIVVSMVFSLWLIIQSTLWPVLVSPLFNRFEPVQNAEIISMVHELADKSGIQIDEILIMDASQRTTKANAYFAGMGKTKQIVLYDNLLEQYSKEEIKAVIAHEIAHWQKGHIVKGMILSIIGCFIVMGGAYLILQKDRVGLKYPPITIVIFILYITLATFISNPFQNYVSRQMEIEADQTAIVLTGDKEAAIELQMNLALRNRSDLCPPPFIEWFSYSHPPVLTRIEKIGEVRN